MLPTLALIQDEKTIDYVAGFDQLGGKDDFTTEMLQERLAKSEVRVRICMYMCTSGKWGA